MGSVYVNRLQGRAIRLLQILPADPDEQLECQLIEVSLDALPTYEALSYVWGDANPRESILCNDQAMEITRSLAQALRKLRPFKGEEVDDRLATVSNISARVVWADAICINQDDIPERNHQVQLMRDISSNAARVMVWLGLDNCGQASKAVAAIQLVTHFLSTYQAFSKDMRQKNVTWDNQGHGHFTFELCETLFHSKSLQDPWTSIRVFFDLPWWSRIWCVQEAFLAGKVAMLYGDECVDGRDVAVFSEWYMREAQYAGDTPQGSSREAIKRANNVFNHRDRDARHLFMVCEDFRDLQATNPRDKVYGLLGLWRPTEKEKNPIEIDYNKSVAGVYTDVVLMAIRDLRDLFVLRFVDHDHDSDDGFPSWVPRWDHGTPQAHTFLWLNKSRLSASKFYAEEPDEALACSGILQVKGVLFDRVVSTSSVLKGGRESFMTDATFRQSFIELWLEAKGERPNTKYPHQVSVTELATTVTFGIIKGSKERRDRDITQPDAWLDIGDLDTEAVHEFLSSFHTFMDSEKYPGNAGAFVQLLDAVHGRRLFRTSRGHLGLGRSGIRDGDFVSVLHGGRVPFVLRPVTSEAHFRLVGDCYVYDIMNRQVYEMFDVEGVKPGVFEIH
ncbi:hypothetical protein D9758_017662 [Tetrapyrgos nigripes]|uniref:Heterokaryon incompatibility domain-containing protein n=1 Tax=Tetrapyrgos nigripes TaxID=182062 RepID=A0A8H5C4Q5_9AGAR|nr:hypothetical protein D9758_017662 [Tetrapyrgos nigripes]